MAKKRKTEEDWTPAIPDNEDTQAAIEELQAMAGRGKWETEQDGFLATISGIPQELGNTIVHRAHALGYVNALWDPSLQRVAIPTYSFYPDHDIAVAARGRLDK